MRQRLSICTGLGNPNRCELENNFDFKSLPFCDELAKDLIDNFSLIKKYKGFDFNIENDIVTFGIEPTYQGDRLEIIGVNLRNKQLSYWKKGIARGAYGTQICSTTRGYDMYKYKAKFTKFIDKWFDKLREQIETRITDKE